MGRARGWWATVVWSALWSVAGSGAFAGVPPLPGAGERRIAIEKLCVLGSVLYIGAHPDDENTALLATLAKGRRLRTAYLSLTRGDGGQNLIGTEQGDALGVIRTQELLAARRVDGAEQLFTRAVDFGYSKSAEETLRIWGHQEVLADVVWVIRWFRPDVVISRFPENGDGGHGHHTASAILAREAFEAAGDASRFPEQLAWLEPWRPTRLLWNAWRRPDALPSATPTPHRLTVDLGTYDPLLGQAYTELAATARTFHKSQGFGAAPRRGSVPNELELVAGKPAERDLMEGIDTTWRRVPGSETVAAALRASLAVYSELAPERAVPDLVAALGAIEALPADPWVRVKHGEVLAAIQACSGLWLEATAAAPSVTPDGTLKLTATAINRSPLPLRLVRVVPPLGATPVPRDVPLEDNQPVATQVEVAVPADAPYTQPYWLATAHGNGLHEVTDRRAVGRPEASPPFVVTFAVALAGRELALEVPVEHRVTDPVNGERSRIVGVVPDVTVSFQAPVVLLTTSQPRPVHLVVTAQRPDVAIQVGLVAPTGFAVTPEAADVRIDAAGRDQLVTFTITPPRNQARGVLQARILTGRAESARSMVTLDHSHIPTQVLLPEAAVRVLHLDAVSPVHRVGYIPGAGDEVAAVLRQLGIAVTVLDEAALAGADLASFEAIVTGVRAYNTRTDLATAQPRLLSYVASGGTLVVQYATARGLLTERLGPAPMSLSHDRVTDENAPVRFLLPSHRVLNTPNRITLSDFSEWVQERGLYFPSQWDASYEAPLAMADPGEKETAGALLVVRHGAGAFVYSGLAFFRQLPAGNPGAIRLFLNVLGAGR